MIKLLILLPFLALFALLFIQAVKHCRSGKCVLIVLGVFLMFTLTLANATVPQLSVAVMMDDDLSRYYTSDDEARQAIASYIGDVDATYTQQFGLHVAVTSIQLHANTPDDTQPVFLLSKLVNYPHGDANVLLFLTQRKLHIGEQLYAGYSTTTPLCHYSATSVVEVRHDNFIDGLIIKHEIGHAIGLPHDGTGVCAAESSSAYIMAPVAMYATTQFSQCDVTLVQAELAADSSCLKSQTPALSPAPVASTPTQYGGGAFSWLWLLGLGMVWALMCAGSRTK